ncbi:holo-ACP synthase [Streptococcus sp. zg-86]|uniref:Holo-[acyl-carrier-protein] synthase n=1 Tax=Streptococcus zhangguiae TaxID=2664091 RepID=A0A6I4RDI8_9STRE|nr:MULTISPECIES: holo-ACP synthase [unclassified Streptococcus]MTB63683.1 holo-ACP synthase [Streptococcus sp. zg-86]MTB89993.1 holo-ACP synthase [Streptococcus sp. zg-36]MWV55664.1 holo-ACP synthase [Streptococcus sp. zg-70]QTH48043.1 holo-ACP synthase [Streptococcus sp. zg-86]
MIIGHGIDIQEMAAVEVAMKKHERFASKVLTENELDRFRQLKHRRQVEYLAGRWSAKEAFVKALGTGIGQVGFHDIEILTDKKGAPYIAKSPIQAKSWISISHSAGFVQASVILEEVDESKHS